MSSITGSDERRTSVNLEDAWVLVTGASRGVGVTIAEEFAKRKAKLVLVARSMDGLKKTCDLVEEAGGQAHPISFDLENISKMEDLVAETRQVAPHIDVLVNNAGLEKYYCYTEYRTEDITSILSVNLMAPMELTRLLLPDMLERRTGHIFNISSLGGKIGEIYNTLYMTSKGGMDLWTDTLRRELYKTGVKITAIAPGGITDTGMIHNIGVPYPALLGSCTSKDVAEAVIKCTSKYRSRVYVNSLPVMPLILLNEIFPLALDALCRWMGISKVNKEKVTRRLGATATARSPSARTR